MADVGTHGLDESTTHDQTVAPKQDIDRLEIVGTVLLGIAAVLIAWCTYQGHLWGGVQDTRNTASGLASIQSADSLGRGDALSSLDQLLFADWVVLPDGDQVKELLYKQMSDPGQAAATDWLTNNEVRPFDADIYIIQTYGDGFAMSDAASALFDAAAAANTESDKYTLAATIVALVLFLTGVSLVLKGRLTRMILVIGSAIILAGVLLSVVGLPLAGNADSSDAIRFAAQDESIRTLPLKLFYPFYGDTVHAVYLGPFAGESASDLARTIDEVETEGYDVYTEPLACDQGAAEALALQDNDVLSKVYFRTEEFALTFANDYDVATSNIVPVVLLDSESC